MTCLRASALLSTLALVAPTGCSILPFPFNRSPEDHARDVEKRCKNTDEESVARIMSADALDRVDPTYSYVQTGNDRRANLRGAAIHIRPLPGLSSESITRSLECHEARVVLGNMQPLPDDPLVLPGRWINLDVSSEGDEFVALARADAIGDAQIVLERARRFAAARTHP